jgi:hypothetical protein
MILIPVNNLCLCARHRRWKLLLVSVRCSSYQPAQMMPSNVNERAGCLLSLHDLFMCLVHTTGVLFSRDYHLMTPGHRFDLSLGVVVYHTLLGCITEFSDRVASPLYNARLARTGFDEDTITRTPFMPWKYGLECMAPNIIYMFSSSANQHVPQEAFVPSSFPSLFTSDLRSLSCFRSLS